MNLEKVDNIVFGQIDHKDYPDYSDAYIVSANYDGIKMNHEQLEELSNNRDFVYTKLMDYLH